MDDFWSWRREEEWPPDSVCWPDEFAGGERLNITCTQTGLPASKQRKLVRSWCETLPNLAGVRFVWFTSRVSQQLFDAACAVPGLEGLYVKWSGIKSLEALRQASVLRYLHVGSSAGVESIEPLQKLTGLRWLGIENFKRIRSLDPLAALVGLEGLRVEGSMWTTQRVDTLAPIGELGGLKFLALTNLRAADKTLAPLFKLRQLEEFRVALWWPREEVEELWRRNPGLEPYKLSLNTE